MKFIEVKSLAEKKSGLKSHPRKPKGGTRGGKLLQHRHCQVCSKAIPFSEEFCSEECKIEFEGMIKKRKSYIYIIYGTMVFILVIFFLSFL